ncbi:MAG: hypothetical protein FWG93_04930 [Oscillospiraceae bacterium]|nr:hypothetical protein [Oscillospiraceae bacterium]
MRKQAAVRHTAKRCVVFLLFFVLLVFLSGLSISLHIHHDHGHSRDFDPEETGGVCAVCAHIQSAVKAAVYSPSLVFTGLLAVTAAVCFVFPRSASPTPVVLKTRMNQ